jgi:hypothetical protein
VKEEESWFEQNTKERNQTKLIVVENRPFGGETLLRRFQEFGCLNMDQRPKNLSNSAKIRDIVIVLYGIATGNEELARIETGRSTDVAPA